MKRITQIVATAVNDPYYNLPYLFAVVEDYEDKSPLPVQYMAFWHWGNAGWVHLEEFPVENRTQDRSKSAIIDLY